MTDGDTIRFIRGKHPGTEFRVERLTETYYWLEPTNRSAKRVVRKHVKMYRDHVEANAVVIRSVS